MDRYWFFTWRTYGTWLPGVPGFVGTYRTVHGRRVVDNQYNQLTTEPIPALARYAKGVQTHVPVYLAPEQAPVVLLELLRTCTFRGWRPDAIAVMPDHVHVLVAVVGDPDPANVLGEFKSYVSRALNRINPRPKGWWWVDGGSKRRVRNEMGRATVICYIRDQASAYLVWVSGEARSLLLNPQLVALAPSPAALAGGVHPDFDLLHTAPLSGAPS